MGTLSGSPDPAVLVFALERGEYDEHLYSIDQALHRRRDTFDRLGIIQPSAGDWVEIWDEKNPTEDVTVPRLIRGQTLRVVGFRKDRRLRCRVERPVTIGDKTLERNKVILVDRDWVYRVHYAPK